MAASLQANDLQRHASHWAWETSRKSPEAFVEILAIAARDGADPVVRQMMQEIDLVAVTETFDQDRIQYHGSTEVVERARVHDTVLTLLTGLESAEEFISACVDAWPDEPFLRARAALARVESRAEFEMASTLDLMRFRKALGRVKSEALRNGLLERAVRVYAKVGDYESALKLCEDPVLQPAQPFYLRLATIRRAAAVEDFDQANIMAAELRRNLAGIDRRELIFPKLEIMGELALVYEASPQPQEAKALLHAAIVELFAFEWPLRDGERFDDISRYLIGGSRQLSRQLVGHYVRLAGIAALADPPWSEYSAYGAEVEAINTLHESVANQVLALEATGEVGQAAAWRDAYVAELRRWGSKINEIDFNLGKGHEREAEFAGLCSRATEDQFRADLARLLELPWNERIRDCALSFGIEYYVGVDNLARASALLGQSERGPEGEEFLTVALVAALGRAGRFDDAVAMWELMDGETTSDSAKTSALRALTYDMARQGDFEGAQALLTSVPLSQSKYGFNLKRGLDNIARGGIKAGHYRAALTWWDGAAAELELSASAQDVARSFLVVEVLDELIAREAALEALAFLPEITPKLRRHHLQRVVAQLSDVKLSAAHQQFLSTAIAGLE